MKELRGRIDRDVGMAKLTWLCVGGHADAIFHPADVEDLARFLREKPQGPLYVMGAGSNLLVRDGGIRGTVVRLGRGFRDWVMHTSTDVEMGAGVLDRYAAQKCQEHGLSGFEFLYTIPGTIGGGLAMNAGCYGGECADRLLWARVMDPQGIVHRLSRNDIDFGYRRCSLPTGWIFLSACFRGTVSDPETVSQTMMALSHQRNTTQPTHVKTGGSTFANTPEHAAWVLIDQAGFRGRTRGEAQISPKHCNFLINHGHCTAADLEDLAEEARQAVQAQTGISLTWEIVRWGERATS